MVHIFYSDHFSFLKPDLTSLDMEGRNILPDPKKIWKNLHEGPLTSISSDNDLKQILAYFLYQLFFQNDNFSCFFLFYITDNKVFHPVI